MARRSSPLAVLGMAVVALGGCADDAPPVTATRVVDVSGLREIVNAVGLAPDGGLVAVADADGNLTMYDLPAGAVRWKVRVHAAGAAHRIDAVGFSPDGTLVATAGDGSRTVALWEAAGGRAAGLVAVPGVRALAFHPTDRVLAVAAHATVSIVDLATAEVTRALPNAHQGDAVYAVAFSADGRALATASAHGSLKLWHWPALTLRASVAMAPALEALTPVALALSATGTRAALNGILGRVHVVDTVREREERTFANAPAAPGHDRHGEMRHALAFAADEHWLLAPDVHDRGLRVVHVPSGRSHGAIRGGAPFYKAVAIATSATWVALLHPGDGQGQGPYGLEVWRLAYGAK